jgi:hypothetical protein
LQPRNAFHTEQAQAIIDDARVAVKEITKDHSDDDRRGDFRDIEGCAKDAAPADQLAVERHSQEQRESHFEREIE